MYVGIPRDAFHIAECLLDSLAKCDPNIFGGMVMIDVQVAFGLDRDVDPRVPRKQVEHMVKKTYAGCNRSTAGSVEIDFDLDVGFLGPALNGSFAHAKILCSRLLSGVCGIRHSVANGLQIRRVMTR